MTSTTRRHLRPLLWRWTPHPEQHGLRLGALVQSTLEETAALLGLPVELARTAFEGEPLYVLLGRERWLSTN
jgi:hypothetical protein